MGRRAQRGLFERPPYNHAAPRQPRVSHADIVTQLRLKHRASLEARLDELMRAHDRIVQQQLEAIDNVIAQSSRPSRFASLATLVCVIICVLSLTGQFIVGGIEFGALAALSFAILAAIVLAHSN